MSGRVPPPSNDYKTERSTASWSHPHLLLVPPTSKATTLSRNLHSPNLFTLNMSLEQVLASIRQTIVTNIVHRESYPAISPTHPELSQAGPSILITGGGTGAGFAMAKAFIRASAATLIIIGRRADVLGTSQASLAEESKTTGTGTKIITQTCDVTNLAEIDALWANIGAKNIIVDVYIANAAKFTEPQSMLSFETTEVWNLVETNVTSPLYFAKKLHSQPNSDPDKQKVTSIHA
jgi:hypothetical protein